MIVACDRPNRRGVGVGRVTCFDLSFSARTARSLLRRHDPGCAVRVGMPFESLASGSRLEISGLFWVGRARRPPMQRHGRRDGRNAGRDTATLSGSASRPRDACDCSADASSPKISFPGRRWRRCRGSRCKKCPGIHGISGKPQDSSQIRLVTGVSFQHPSRGCRGW